MLNVNSYNVKYRFFVYVAHKLIPFHKTRRSQSPPGARPHAGTSSHGSGQRPIRCPFHTTAASPCLALQCHATPRNALQCPAQSGCFRILPANVMRWRWDTKIVVSSFVAGLSRNPCCRPVAFPRLCSARRPLAACLHITSLTGLFRAFRAASCSAHRIATAFMPPKPASSARGFGYFPAGVPGVFAFPGRREDTVYKCRTSCQ